MRVILAEGISDVKFLAGLLGVTNLGKASTDAKKIISSYRCYKHAIY